MYINISELARAHANEYGNASVHAGMQSALDLQHLYAAGKILYQHATNVGTAVAQMLLPLIFWGCSFGLITPCITLASTRYTCVSSEQKPK